MPKPKTPAPAAPVSDAPRTLPVQDLDTVWLPCAALTPWAKNPRKNAAAIPKVAASLRAFGFVAPVVVWKEGARMVAGHTRLAALQSILAEEPTFIPKGAPPGALPGMLPVRFHPFASEAEADAYGIADNRLNEIAEWDSAALDGLLDSLNVDLVALSGFTLELPVLPRLNDTDPLVSGSAQASEAPIRDDFPLPNMGAPTSTVELAVRFGRYRFTMTQAEAALFVAAFESFKARTGTYDGFIGSLIARL